MLYNQWKYNRAKYSTADLEDGLIAITAAGSVVCSGEQIRYVDSSVQFNANSSATVNAKRIKDSGALAAGDTVVAVVYIRKRNTTMVSYAQSSASSEANRVVSASCSVSANASATSTAQGIYQTNSAIVTVCSFEANSVKIVEASSTIIVESTTVVIPNRIRSSSALTAGVSASMAVGREKWEDVNETAMTWSSVEENATTWNTKAETSTNWTDIAA